MDKIFILNLCIILNLFFLFAFFGFLFFFKNTSSDYFRFGWSDTFKFITISINTPLRYFALCIFIFILNITEIFLNDLAGPIIQFSTYNPYKNSILDFSRCQLEIYSNLIFFIQTTKKFVQVITIMSQLDIALISLISSQISATLAIRYLLNDKLFEMENYIYVNHELPKYNSINEKTYLNI
jgi:hypothetical protein